MNINARLAGSAVILAFFTFATVIHAEEGRRGPKTVPMDAEQRAAMLARTGGPITTPERGPWIAVVEGKTDLPENAVKDVAEYLRKAFRVPVHEIKEDQNAVAVARRELANGAAIAVAVVSGNSEESLTVHPSDQYGVVDVSALKSDDSNLFSSRFRKEFLRCAGYVLGIGNAEGNCLLKPVKGLEELDALQMRGFGPETLTAGLRAVRARGMTPIRTVPYKRAVEEGWAPPPTNDYQRAIWDGIKNASTNSPFAK